MVDKKQFKLIIKRASQPIRPDLEKSGKGKDDYYSDRQTRQHKTEDTSGKHSDKYH